MKVAILITLNYLHESFEDTTFVWSAIQGAMLEAGFKYNGRLFTINMPKTSQAYELARSAVESLESHIPFDERRIHRFLKDFYGFKLEDSENLLLPRAESIEVVA